MLDDLLHEGLGHVGASSRTQAVQQSLRYHRHEFWATMGPSKSSSVTAYFTQLLEQVTAPEASPAASTAALSLLSSSLGHTSAPVLEAIVARVLPVVRGVLTKKSSPAQATQCASECVAVLVARAPGSSVLKAAILAFITEDLLGHLIGYCGNEVVGDAAMGLLQDLSTHFPAQLRPQGRKIMQACLPCIDHPLVHRQESAAACMAELAFHTVTKEELATSLLSQLMVEIDLLLTHTLPTDVCGAAALPEGGPRLDPELSAFPTQPDQDAVIIRLRGLCTLLIRCLQRGRSVLAPSVLPVAKLLAIVQRVLGLRSATSDRHSRYVSAEHGRLSPAAVDAVLPLCHEQGLLLLATAIASLGSRCVRWTSSISDLVTQAVTVFAAPEFRRKTKRRCPVVVPELCVAALACFGNAMTALTPHTAAKLCSAILTVPVRIVDATCVPSVDAAASESDGSRITIARRGAKRKAAGAESAAAPTPVNVDVLYVAAGFDDRCTLAAIQAIQQALVVCGSQFDFNLRNRVETTLLAAVAAAQDRNAARVMLDAAQALTSSVDLVASSAAGATGTGAAASAQSTVASSSNNMASLKAATLSGVTAAVPASLLVPLAAVHAQIRQTLLEALLATVLSPSPHGCTAQCVSGASTLFQQGTADANPQVASTSWLGLRACEVLIHPRAAPLGVDAVARYAKSASTASTANDFNPMAIASHVAAREDEEEDDDHNKHDEDDAMDGKVAAAPAPNLSSTISTAAAGTAGKPAAWSVAPARPGTSAAAAPPAAPTPTKAAPSKATAPAPAVPSANSTVAPLPGFVDEDPDSD